MRSDVQDRADNEQRQECKPQPAVDQAKRPPVEHHRTQVQRDVRGHHSRHDGIAPWNLLDVVNIVAECREDQEKESSQPERP